MLIQAAVVEPHIRIRLRRVLPMRGEVITGNGQTVNPMQTVARTTQFARYRILPLSEMLRIPPAELPALLLTPPGARVKQGAMLIDRKGFLGRRQQYQSPLDAEVYEVSNGRVILRQMSEVVELRALVAGTVVEQIAQRGVVLETFGALLQPAWSTDHEEAGLLKVLASAPDAQFFPEQLTTEHNGAILVVGCIEQPRVLERAHEMGVRGLIAGSVPAHICTQARRLEMPLFVTDGIGLFGMSRPAFAILRDAEGQRTALLGKTSGRPGEKPQIIIQSDKKTTTLASTGMEAVAVGQKVRLLRAPYLNQMATVGRLYQLAQTTAVGNKVHGADVRLEDGRVVFVPYANMEAIL